MMEVLTSLNRLWQRAVLRWADSALTARHDLAGSADISKLSPAHLCEGQPNRPNFRFAYCLLLTAVAAGVARPAVSQSLSPAGPVAPVLMSQVSPDGYGYPGGYGPARGGYGYPRGGYGDNGSAPQSAPQSDPSVADLQRRLADLGYYNGEITGYYGSMTQDAVFRFQRDVGLAADGIVGPATEAALYRQIGPGAAGAGNSAADSAAPNGFLQLNNSGDQVAELQRRLTDLGYYSGSVSGVFDGSTQEAVIRFQQANGLSPDGVVGPATESSLRNPAGQYIQPAAANPASASSPNGILQIGDTGSAVSDLQQQLQTLGFYDGPISGTYDPQTEVAVMAFQRSNNLIPDGIAGPQVASTLRTASPAASSAANPDLAPAAASSPAASSSASPVTTAAATPPAVTATQPQATAQAQQAQLEAEQARLEAEQARLMFQQNLEEGRYSVAELQRRLRKLGYYPGEINGMLTPETQKAIDDAQRKYGLSDADLSLDYAPASPAAEVQSAAPAVMPSAPPSF